MASCSAATKTGSIRKIYQVVCYITPWCQQHSALRCQPQTSPSASHKTAYPRTHYWLLCKWGAGCVHCMSASALFAADAQPSSACAAAKASPGSLPWWFLLHTCVSHQCCQEHMPRSQARDRDPALAWPAQIMQNVRKPAFEATKPERTYFHSLGTAVPGTGLSSGGCRAGVQYVHARTHACMNHMMTFEWALDCGCWRAVILGSQQAAPRLTIWSCSQPCMPHPPTLTYSAPAPGW